jgi:hypothetical protein
MAECVVIPRLRHAGRDCSHCALYQAEQSSTSATAKARRAVSRSGAASPVRREAYNVATTTELGLVDGDRSQSPMAERMMVTATPRDHCPSANAIDAQTAACVYWPPFSRTPGT